MALREIRSTENNGVKVQAQNKKGDTSDNHEYYLSPYVNPDEHPAGELGHIFFQEGPIAEEGVNGCQCEDILDILIDRLTIYFKRVLFFVRKIN